MSFARKIRTFTKMEPALKWLFFKAFFISAGVKFTLLFLPFKRVMNWLGKPNTETPKDPDPVNFAGIKKVEQALVLCDKYAPWPTECYTRALTAKILLKQKKLPSTLYIGFMKDETGKYKGHAWLRCADRIVTGKENHQLYTVQSYFT